MSNNQQEENEEIKKRRPSPLRIEILKEESRNNNNTVKEPSTPLSSEHFEYSTYRTRYNWFVNKESSNYTPSSPEPNTKVFKDNKDNCMIATNYTKYLIKPRSSKSKFNLTQMKNETNYRTTYRRKLDTTWYTTVHVWSNNARSPSLSPIRKVKTIKGLQLTNISPRRFSLGR